MFGDAPRRPAGAAAQAPRGLGGSAGRSGSRWDGTGGSVRAIRRPRSPGRATCATSPVTAGAQHAAPRLHDVQQAIPPRQPGWVEGAAMKGEEAATALAAGPT